ncbi:SH3 domain-containing protein [Candidatus Latescibacterota bacterium]
MSRYCRNTLSLLILLLFSTLSLSWSQESKPRHAPNALPGVEPEMLTPEYWIALNDDAAKIIMSPDEIKQFNKQVRSKEGGNSRYEGPLRNPVLPLDLPDTLPSSILAKWLASNQEKLMMPDDMWGSRDFYDGRNTIYNDDMKQAIVDKMNMEGIPNVINRRFGIIIKHANVRQYPTHVPGYHDTETELDRYQITDLCIGNPVAILHQSHDGDFLYVESPIARGWVGTGDVAIDSRESIRDLTDTSKLLMATGNKVPVYGDPAFKNFALYCFMSATLPLISKDGTGYTVKLPYRKPDGSLGIANGYIKPNADVNTGHLPYSKSSIITQMFKLLNTPYGWHGQDNKRDCAGTLRIVFRCCGIVTGRYLGIASIHRTLFEPDMEIDDKMAAVAKIEPVITIASDPGHVTLYLGQAHNGMLYFMHQGGWGYKDENGDHLYVNRVSINAANHSWYNIKSPITFTTIKN